MDFRKPASRILFIGHRGFPALAPENTLPSFERALDAGCDAIECDVRITKDGHFVVMHDETPARTTDAAERFPGKNPRVSDLTPARRGQLVCRAGSLREHRVLPSFTEGSRSVPRSCRARTQRSF